MGASTTQRRARRALSPLCARERRCFQPHCLFSARGRQSDSHASPLQGCQIQRESQTKFSLCCEDITASWNSTHHELLIDVAVPEHDHGAADRFRHLDAVLAAIDETLKRALKPPSS